MKRIQMRSCFLCLLVLVTVLSFAVAQEAASSQAEAGRSGPKSSTAIEEKNVQEYIDLLRSNVRQEKAEIMGAVMQLHVDDAAKFWPIYTEYDAELTKLNDLRVANIREYASSYDGMNDAKADELIQKALQYHKQRSDLLAKYYERVKQSLGAVQAARFLQVENQLLLIIDLQIHSALPIVAKES